MLNYGQGRKGTYLFVPLTIIFLHHKSTQEIIYALHVLNGTFNLKLIKAHDHPHFPRQEEGQKDPSLADEQSKYNPRDVMDFKTSLGNLNLPKWFRVDKDCFRFYESHKSSPRNSSI